MYYTKSERPGMYKNVKYWVSHSLLVAGCLWTFLMLGGCKEPQSVAVPSVSAQAPVSTEVNEAQMDEYLNNANAEKMPTPEIMDTDGISDLNEEEKPVSDQLGVKF